MNNYLLMGIILFSSMLGIAIITVLILALCQQNKIKHFKTKKNELQTMIDHHQSFLVNPLTAIQIKYQLPSNEICYYQATINGNEIIKKKELRQNTYYLNQQMTNKYHIEYLTGYLNLTTFQEGDPIDGTLYVTNHRLVLQTKEKNIIIWLKDLNFALPSVFNLRGLYQIGFFISTTTKIYRFITDDIKISMAIFKTWQQKGG